MDTLWTYFPICIALGLFLTGMLYQRRHPDSERARSVMLVLAVSAVLICGVQGVIALGWWVFVERVPGMFVPLVLLVVLIAFISTAMFSLIQPRPVTTAAVRSADRSSMTRFAIAASLVVALLAYGIGYFAGDWAGRLNSGMPDLALPGGILGLLVVVASMVPWFVLKCLAARRRHIAENALPASAEVIDRVMEEVAEAQLDERSFYSYSPLRPIITWCVAVLLGGVLLFLIPLIPAWISDATGEESSVNSGFVQVGIVAMAAVIAWILLVTFFLLPLLRGARSEYLAAALSDGDRLRGEAKLLRESAQHRFEARLTDPNRSIRVLTISGSGTVRLEQKPAGDLLWEYSSPLAGDEDDEAEDDVDFPLDDLTRGDQSIVRVLVALYDRGGEYEFDIFEARYGSEVHIVAVGADDYRDFPQDLAQDLTVSRI